MRRIKDTKVNETLDNAHVAFDHYVEHKHGRKAVQKFEEHLEDNLIDVIKKITDESWTPKPYIPKTIYEKKKRQLAKAPVRDHVQETVTIYPYLKSFYDYTSWRVPAVKPGMGTHGLMRDMRNELYRESQKEMMYNLCIDAHHYFPRMDHVILKNAINDKVKDGKLRRFLYKVVDSYAQGAPLGIFVSQLFGQIYLARFDRDCMRFFDIYKNVEKLHFWGNEYVTQKILTAKTPDEFNLLCRGPSYLFNRFCCYAKAGFPHYYRFVDNILIYHEDKTFLLIAKQIILSTLATNYHIIINKDYNIRPTWMGVRVCGYVFYHDHLLASKDNKQRLARKIQKLKKRGLTEEQIRIHCASMIGYIKHADAINLFKKLGMEKSLGKIIKNRRIKLPFVGMRPEQKEKFTDICAKNEFSEDKKILSWNHKILLEDYIIQDSKIEKETTIVAVIDANGNKQNIEKKIPSKVLVLRYKKILKTFETHTVDGIPTESYQFAKEINEKGEATEKDAEYFSYTGSKILIDQAEHDMSPQDLPCPTVIKQTETPQGKTYYKFT